MNLLLDTSAYSALRRGHEAAIELVHDADRILFSPVVAGELIAGFRIGGRARKNMAELRDFLDEPRVRLVPLGEITADRYARIYADLRRMGRPIPTNDMWVAAQAMETGADLVSGDGHFECVAGLAWIDLREF